MTHSYSSMLFHLIWSTKKRSPLILPEMKHRLYGYIRKVAEDEGATIIIINGMPDHVHILLGIKPNMNLSDLIRQIKTTSSKWARTTFQEKGDFGWQEGYGAFSVGMSTLPLVKNYIANQEEHHLTQSFEDEYIGFIEAHALGYDPRFVVE